MADSADLFISTTSGKRDEPVVNYLNDIFLYALANGISDIHFETGANEWFIRIRRQGLLEEIGKVQLATGREMGLKIRSKAKLPAISSDAPLDGRFSLVYRQEGLAADVRVSIVPTEKGSSIVCRVLDQRNAMREFDTIEMLDDVRASIRKLIDEPDGLFLVTGPTGSGKTSTLYSIIGELNTPQRKILTIEDPVEYQVQGLQQIPIGQNNSFASALRAALRQDPDVILVGEIRDRETAQVAVHAASTGHLVLSTLHTNDAPQSIVRMLDLGVDAFTLGASLRGVLAQRLVQGIAGQAESYAPSHEDKIWMHGHGITDLDSPLCRPAIAGDMEGRVPLMELIMVDTQMKNAMARSDLKQIRQAAMKQRQYKTLAQAGVEMVRRGRTTMEEVKHISSSLDDAGTIRKIGEIMVAEGYVTQLQLDRALIKQIEHKTTGRQVLIGELMVEMGFCSRDEVNACVQMQ